MENSRTVYYTFSENLLNESCKNPAVINRAKIVHSLISSYKLLRFMNTLPSEKCKYSEIRNFHSDDYCKILKDSSQLYDRNTEYVNEEYGLGYDCPIWPELYDYVCEIGGSTLTSCRQLIQNNSIVINWFGGWHHSQRDKAAGYCYINDIVLGILELRSKYQRILYIDLDVHHGDGVESAFEATKRVFTLSMHQFETGFYPGSGGVNDCGFGNSKGYSINFPYRSGITGPDFYKYFKRLFELVLEKYKPDVMVIQCGGDIIVGDPLGNSNITPDDMKNCIRLILSVNLPSLFVGGGGYHFTNTSRYWTEITAMICVTSKLLSNDIPDNEYFLEYSPGYELDIAKKTLKNYNDDQYLDKCIVTIEENLIKYDVHDV